MQGDQGPRAHGPLEIKPSAHGPRAPSLSSQGSLGPGPWALGRLNHSTPQPWASLSPPLPVPPLVNPATPTPTSPGPWALGPRPGWARHSRIGMPSYAKELQAQPASQNYSSPSPMNKHFPLISSLGPYLAQNSAHIALQHVWPFSPWPRKTIEQLAGARRLALRTIDSTQIGSRTSITVRHISTKLHEHFEQRGEHGRLDASDKQRGSRKIGTGA